MRAELFVDRLPLLRSLGLEDRRSLLALAEVREYNRHDVIWEQGEKSAEFSFVGDGSVKLVKPGERGRDTILELVQPGELICASGPCAFSAFCCRAKAMESPTRIIGLPRQQLFALFERSRAAADAFRQAIAGRAKHLCQRVEELASGQVDRRILKLIVRLAEEVGQPQDDGLWVPVGLSRQDLADMCGTTIESASRVMTRFARESLVQTEHGGFLLPDLEALRRVLEG